MLMRKKMEQIRTPSEEPYRRLVIDYFNVLLGKRPESDMYWRIELKVRFTSPWEYKKLSLNIQTNIENIEQKIRPWPNAEGNGRGL